MKGEVANWDKIHVTLLWVDPHLNKFCKQINFFF